MTYKLRVSLEKLALGFALLAVLGCRDRPGEPQAAVRAQAQILDTSDAGEADAGDEDAGSTHADEDAGAGTLGDAQIITVVTTLNSAEIEQGEFALARADLPEARDYARRMVSEHTAANELAAEVFANIQAESTPSGTSRELSERATETLAALASTPSPAFNLAYVRVQAEEHAEVLKLIDSLLFPQTDSPTVRAFLQLVRSHVEEHLAQAQAILAAAASE